MRLGVQTIVRKRSTATTKDEYGNDVPDWSAPAELVITGCSVQPGGGSQFIDDREAVTTLFTAWAPVADVLDTDRISYAGTDYDIDGPVERWQVGTRLDHFVIRLKAVAG